MRRQQIAEIADVIGLPGRDQREIGPQLAAIPDARVYFRSQSGAGPGARGAEIVGFLIQAPSGLKCAVAGH